MVLQELGITYWKLRYPIVLDNENSIKLWWHLRLLLISSDCSISLDDLFVKDVIRAMRINIKSVYVLTINQIKTLIIPEEYFFYCWWIGMEKLSNFNGICLSTPSLSILKCDVKAKCDLWRQISCILLDN
ncbi:DNA polymerase III subunit psi [Blochmannia endosymbiont of Camponotus nipponensis]|uniref:DNA polymerase III subunit psi n=1 Tax=Blochmannia endosymbiont of Camponotus nipponensis TaxID=2681986 RepID=UPI001F20957A|nr:DNA polymerase III subunit psi [Blochmannia endosymbiont of Camponotus nipponensis]